MAIGNCDCCDRRDVPGSVVNVPGEPFACFTCQGDPEPDPYGEIPLLVPCPLCDGSAVQARAVWVYEHGCAFGHYDTEEDPCPECEGNGRVLVDSVPATQEDREQEAA